MKLLSGNSNPPLAQAIAQYCELPLTQASVRRFVAIESAGLAMFLIGAEAEPVEIGANRLDMLFAASLAIGVVEAEDEPAAILPSPQPVVDRGPDIADMEPSGRRRGEAGDDAHGAGSRASGRALP